MPGVYKANLSEGCNERISESRKVLYNPEHTPEDYVATYDNYWAANYNEDGTELGFKSWEYALDRITKLMPNRDALILDYCGGTGQVGKRLYEAGYRHLHINDGSKKMLEQALALNVYEKWHNEVVPKNNKASFLINDGLKYDVVLSSMSLSEFKPFVEQVVKDHLKPGGVFISFESEPHIELAKLDGIPFLIEEAAKPNSYVELIENSSNLPHDTFTDHRMKILIVKRK